MSDEHRAGFVALSGRSNVGKSTLINRLVGEKVAIVSSRPQTTRRRILGIRNEPNAQLIFIDAPGIHEPKGELNRQMVSIARKCLTEGDALVGLVEAADRVRGADRHFLREMTTLKRRKVVAINKIDLIPRKRLIPMAAECHDLVPDAEIVPISALSGENVEELVATVKSMLPLGPALMPADQYTDQTERALAEEIVREKIFNAMREEIPFSTAVRVAEFVEEPERNFTRIAATIVVERESHKGMVIGAGAQQLKRIGIAAREELETLLGGKVYLDLTVKVEHNWTRDPRKVELLGV